jgi:hypothetical protein
MHRCSFGSFGVRLIDLLATVDADADADGSRLLPPLTLNFSVATSLLMCLPELELACVATRLLFVIPRSIFVLTHLCERPVSCRCHDRITMAGCASRGRRAAHRAVEPAGTHQRRHSGSRQVRPLQRTQQL